MNNFNVAIIKPNKFWEDLYKNKEQMDRLTKLDVLENIEIEISKYITFKKLTHVEMMDFIVDTIKLTSDKLGSTSLCYEDKDHVYQLCHYSKVDNGEKEKDEDPENINSIAGFLCSEDINIYGTVVLISSKINTYNNNTCITDTIELTDISRILYNKVVHKGVKVCTNGTVDEFIFYKDPLENKTETEISNYRWVELPFLNFNLIGFIETNPKVDVVNKKITRLIGDKVINGDVLLVSKTTETEYINMDKELFNKLLAVANGPLTKRQLTDFEKKHGEELDGIPIVMNRHCILDRRYKNYKLECNYCSQKIQNDKSVVCSGCYRIKYDSIECQKKDWLNHKYECLYGVEPLNKKNIISTEKI